MGKPKQKIQLPPELPPELPEDDVEVSDEDLQFVNDNLDYAGFVSRLDTNSITRHVTRVADADEDALEALYEKRMRKKAALLKEKEREGGELELDPVVDALPVKTLDGQLHYRTLKESESKGDANDVGEEGNGALSVVRLTKAERRAKLKKTKKDAKKQTEALPQAEQLEQNQRSAVLAEVKEDITAEEASENKKHKLAELGITLLADPESNIKSLKEMLLICKDDDHSIVKLGLLSLLAVFKDIIPGYRIRLPTEKELEMKVSKDVKKMRFYESTLLSAYKVYLQKLMALEKNSLYQHVVIRCICTLLEAHPHFNYRENLIEAVVRNISSSDEVTRKLCCNAVRSLFTNESKHGGQATGEVVRLIADHVKAHNCQMHPDSVEVLLSLTFNEDLVRAERLDKDKKGKSKKNKKRRASDEANQIEDHDRRKTKKELMSKFKEEVTADYKSATFAIDAKEKQMQQSETLATIFEIYFRILKHAMLSISPRPKEDATSSAPITEGHPLLAPCLNGLGKFSHLIDLDYIGDLMNYLKRLASVDGKCNSMGKCLTVAERLRCCIIAFKVMRSNLDALNVDLQDFFVQLYNLILEYRPGIDQGKAFAEALKIMLFEDRQHDMQKAAAFAKRLATFSLSFGPGESLAALVTLKQLLQKNVKCRILLENDPGGGSVSGSIARYQPYASDPNQSGALASVLWELNLLSKHFHPTISSVASGICSMNVAQNPVYHLMLTPVQAFNDLSVEQDSFEPKISAIKSNNKRKRANAVVPLGKEAADVVVSFDEDLIKRKLSEHFSIVGEIQEKERWRKEMDRTELELRLFEEYKKTKKGKGRRDL
ncbi:hypothetical protein MLD38_038012 [Melastoma candidum]|uniref:Uncharacterized protein n=1 Tax=Melastoma candidum TaxID=119954 RepID=A0ACB9KY58_9MYRT|nr:hypothetical protein MLD38_038012 [Melastoma candidum]